MYGVVGYKTHAKMLLIVRREKGVLRRYAHLSTGNYHQVTSKLYTDFGSQISYIDPEVLRLLAGIQHLRGDLKAAIQTMRRAVVVGPGDALAGSYRDLSRREGKVGDRDLGAHRCARRRRRRHTLNDDLARRIAHVDRLRLAARELEETAWFDAVVVNDDADRAADDGPLCRPCANACSNWACG